jgi:Ca-activated chloride channel family protein
MLELHSVSFVWPRLLWLLLCLPIGICLYMGWRRRDAQAPWFARLGQTASRRPGWPALLLLLGLGLLLLAVARPRAIVLLPTRIDTVMLAIDSSGSMRASDVTPSRIEAAQAAARRFVQAQPAQVRLGVVSVAGSAALIQAPTLQRDDLLQAIDSLSLQPGSALGSGIVIALDAMLPASGLDVRKLIEEAPAADTGKPLPAFGQNAPRKADPGSNTSAAVVLISDGQGNAGPDPLKMAQVAADLGVRVYTVGVGTLQGAILKAQGMQARVKLDEDTLQKVADITHAEYFRAENEQALLKVYDDLSARIVLRKHRQTEISAVCAALGMLLVLGGAFWNLARHARVV